MASVEVTWWGQCLDRKIQENLCQKLKSIAELSHSYFKEQIPIKYFNNDIDGNILIDSSLVEKYVKSKNIKTIIHSYNENSDPVVENLLMEIFGESAKSEIKREVFYEINKAALYGIKFVLFDPRGRDVDNSLCFVFLRMDDCDELDGILVYPEDREECHRYHDKKIRESDWFLTKPCINLRYYCETWMDRLLGWIKQFYVSDLKYWRWEDLPGYEELARSVTNNNAKDFDMEKMSEQILDSLHNGLRQEIDKWIITIERMEK